MYLSRITVKNFRNLKDFSLTLRPGLNVLLGENNIGKTNLLDALRLTLATAFSNDTPRLTPDDITRPTTSRTIQVSLWFDLLTTAEQAEFLDLLDYQPPNITASIHFTATYNPTTERWTTRRWGGNHPNTDSGIAEDILHGIPITMLEALRNATSALQPGRQSKLAKLLKTLATKDQQTSIADIIKTANTALETNEFIKGVQTKISAQNNQAIGPTLSQGGLIRTSEPAFDRIAQNLRLVIDNNPTRDPTAAIPDEDIEELRCNGLGYNNLLYLATVMTELHAAKDATMPLLLVEEPEAHLHPQLQTKLADGLRQPTSDNRVQTIVTSHSPTIAAHVPIGDLTIIHRAANDLSATNLDTLTLTTKEQAHLRRLIDVTKATLFFARGLIIVEGITEALLLPVLARRRGTPLEDHAVSVIPLCGVEFSTIAKLFGTDHLRIPTSLVTDSDPDITDKDNWAQATPATGTKAPRVTNLETQCATNPVLRVKTASVTFEYDLANAGTTNPAIMATAWEECHDGMPQILNQTQLAQFGATQEQALHIWRAICIADRGRQKAGFAQALATLLEEKTPQGAYTVPTFTIPTYLEEAIDHALGR
ncbi:MAG: AAA family ATPase [Acidobacteria bacterium]|nr:AAA family ATPase [Acidobacteriota bacterium]